MTTLSDGSSPLRSVMVLDQRARESVFTAARTANSFSEAPVSDEHLRAITELARCPPTIANTNPLRILFVRTDDGKRRLAPLMSEGNRNKTLSAPAVAVLAVDLDFHEKLPELLPFRPELPGVYADDAGLRERHATFNGAMQAAYFLLAVRASGLEAGPMLGFDGEGVDAEFFAGRAWKTILVMNIGEPSMDPSPERLPRLDHDDHVRYV
jgi:3-hydroxypropanoate dehydrogenase